MNKKKKGSKNPTNEYFRMILIVTLTIFIGIILGMISYTVYNFSQVKAYSGNVISQTNVNVSVEVGTRMGMNGDRDALKFGLNGPGGGGIKYLDINSTERALVNLYLSGNISDYLSVEKNDFIIEAGEFVHLPINLELPTNMSFGNYTGVITVVLTRP